jgi:hypothetical protein
MITKADCLSILVKLEDKGLDINPYMKKLAISKEIPLDVLRFISDNRGIEVSEFYEMLRKSHNQKKSPLYTNILKEVNNPKDIILTLSCLLTQVILYGSKLENAESFLKEVRAEEITRALNTYFKESSIETGATLLKLIKSDLMVLEYIRGRRELE